MWTSFSLIYLTQAVLVNAKISAMAEAYDVAVAPHCPLGPIALAACVQMDTCTPNVFIQEQSLGIHYNQGSDLLDYLNDRSVFTYKDGFTDILTRPGLGIDVNEELVEEMAKRATIGKIRFGGTTMERLRSGDSAPWKGRTMDVKKSRY